MIVTAKNVDEAVSIAQSLADSGKYDLFRGQIRNFPIQPTIFRSGVDIERAMNQLNEFAAWVHTVPELKSIHDNADAIMAVAQHYGFKTPFLDFSTDPKVAGFFASDGNLPTVNNLEYEESCIICVSRKVLEKSWEDLNLRSKNENHQGLVRIVDIDVRNLWRLQAQCGLFLDVKVDSMLLEMFSYFFRIIFPYNGIAKNINHEQIYPKERSHLEVLLKEYFYSTNFEERIKELKKTFHFIHASKEPFLGVQKAFLSGDFPNILSSWNDDIFMQWLDEPHEHYNNLIKNYSIQFSIYDSDTPLSLKNRIEQQINNALNRDNNLRNCSIKWSINDTNGQPFTVDDEYAEQFDDDSCPQLDVSQMLSLLWDGIRRLPYSDNQIASCIGTYISIAKFSSNGIKSLFGDTLAVEFSSIGARNVAIVSSKTLCSCIRNDFANLLTSIEQKRYELSSSYEAMGIIVEPSRLFEFTPFVDLFIREVIPTQLSIRLGGDMLIFSPARLKIFGNN